MMLKAGLHIVSTPIGNLNDISLRAITTLKNSDIILCEDSRTTQKLLLKHNILDKKLIVYNDHATESLRNKIIEQIAAGARMSLVSDAGTPTISDPGYKLVRTLREKDLLVDIVPGPCAAIAGLVLSGLPTDKFYFAGFAPKTEHARSKLLEPCARLDASIILYEAAPRLEATLKAISKTLGNREIAIAREITKIHQEVINDRVDNILANFDTLTLKGEFVLIISKSDSSTALSQQEITKLVKQYLAKGMSARDIQDIILEKYGIKIPRNEIYNTKSQIDL